MIFKKLKINNLKGDNLFLTIFVSIVAMVIGVVFALYPESPFPFLMALLMAAMFGVLTYLFDEDGDHFWIGFLFLIIPYGLISLVLSPFITWWGIIILIIIAHEIAFGLDDEKIGKKESEFRFTVRKKFEAITEGLIVLVLASIFGKALGGIVIYIKWLIDNWSLAIDKIINGALFIARCMGYTIGCIIILGVAALIFYLYIKLNIKLNKEKYIKK